MALQFWRAIFVFRDVITVFVAVLFTPSSSVIVNVFPETEYSVVSAIPTMLIMRSLVYKLNHPVHTANIPAAKLISPSTQ